MNLVGGLALSSPAVLVLVPGAIAALVYAYRRYGRGQRKPVGTVLLLKALERTAAARQKFEPPPRFFLELLLLLVLLLGAAGLYRRDAGGRIVVVLDNSMSMAAAGTGELRTLLERAKELAQSTVDSLPTDARVALVTPVQQNVPQLGSVDEAYEAIGQVQPAYVSDNLERLIARLAGDPRFDRVLVFTDRAPTYLTPEAKARVEVTTVAERPSGNIAVSDVALTTGPTGGRTVRTSISSYVDNPVKVDITVEAIDLLGVTTVVKREVVDLPAKASRSFEFGDTTARPAAFRIGIGPHAGATPGVDSISLDNVAWVSAAPPAEQITVVSDLSAEALGLGRLRHLRFEVIKPGAWESRSAGDRSTTIFHRFTPPTFPPTNALFILPPAGGIFDTGAPEVDGVVTRWNDADPIAAYLNLPALTFKHLTPLTLPPWGREAIATTAGTAAFSGTFEGNRYIVTGFEIFPYEGGKNRIMSVLSLNALGWLADSSIGFEPVGAGIEITPATEQIRSVGGDTVWDSGSGAPATVTIDQPGLFAVRSSGEPERGRVFNFFDERESNTLVRLPVTVSRANVGEHEATAEERGYLTTALACVALLLIALDLFLFAFRATGASAHPWGRAR